MEAEKFRIDIEKAFPLFDEREIDLHISHFKQFLKLEKEKKTLLEAFKSLKKKQAVKEVNSIDVDFAKEKGELVKEKTEKQLVEMRNKVQEWKKQKEVEQFIKEEKRREEDLEFQRQLERKLEEERKNRDKAQKQIQEFREKQKAKKEAERKRGQSHKVIVSNEVIQRIEEKEKQMMERKEKLRLRKKIHLIESQMKMEDFHQKHKQKFKNLESKFTQETKSNVQKYREKFDYQKDLPGVAGNFAGVLVRTTGKKLFSYMHN